MATSLDQQHNPQPPNVILLAHKNVLMYAAVGDYPEFETKRPLKHFKAIKTLKAIALSVVHIVIDPLAYDDELLKLVKTMCVNTKRAHVHSEIGRDER